MGNVRENRRSPNEKDNQTVNWRVSTNVAVKSFSLSTNAIVVARNNTGQRPFRKQIAYAQGRRRSKAVRALEIFACDRPQETHPPRFLAGRPDFTRRIAKSLNLWYTNIHYTRGRTYKVSRKCVRKFESEIMFREVMVPKLECRGSASKFSFPKIQNSHAKLREIVIYENSSSEMSWRLVIPQFESRDDVSKFDFSKIWIYIKVSASRSVFRMHV